MGWTQIGNEIELPAELAEAPIKLGYRVQKKLGSRVRIPGPIDGRARQSQRHVCIEICVATKNGFFVFGSSKKRASPCAQSSRTVRYHTTVDIISARQQLPTNDLRRSREARARSNTSGMTHSPPV